MYVNEHYGIQWAWLGQMVLGVFLFLIWPVLGQTSTFLMLFK